MRAVASAVFGRSHTRQARGGADVEVAGRLALDRIHSGVNNLHILFCTFDILLSCFGGSDRGTVC